MSWGPTFDSRDTRILHSILKIHASKPHLGPQSSCLCTYCLFEACCRLKCRTAYTTTFSRGGPQEENGIMEGMWVSRDDRMLKEHTIYRCFTQKPTSSGPFQPFPTHPWAACRALCLYGAWGV